MSDFNVPGSRPKKTRWNFGNRPQQNSPSKLINSFQTALTPNPEQFYEYYSVTKQYDRKSTVPEEYAEPAAEWCRSQDINDNINNDYNSNADITHDFVRMTATNSDDMRIIIIMLIRPNRKRRSKKIWVWVKEDLKCRGWTFLAHRLIS